MKTFLRDVNLWNAVEFETELLVLKENASQAQVKQYEEDIAKRYRALSFIHSAVSESVFNKIMGCETANKACSKLEKEFLGSARSKQVRLQNLRRKYELLIMKENQTIDEFVEDLMKLVNQIRLMGDSLIDLKVVEKIMLSLPERFDPTITSLEQVKDITELSILDSVSALEADEQRKAARRDERVDHALAARAKGKAPADPSFKKNSNENKEKDKAGTAAGRSQNKRGKFSVCPYCKKRNHSEAYCWFRLGVKCNACKQLGHVEKVCKNKAEAANKKPQVTKQVEKAEVAEEVLFMTIENSNSADNNHWLLDSACSNHMTSKAELFSELDTDHCSSVKIGNGLILDAVGKGTVAIQTASGTRYVLNVLLVSEITHNLLSVGQLVDEDYMLVFKNNACTVYEPSGVYIMSVPMLNLPKLHGDSPICSSCQYGKLTRRSFPKASLNRAKHRLELVHSDVAGPMSEPSLNGSKYFVIFIDDMSRMTWIYFIQHKSEVFSVFQKFKAKVENESGCRIKKLRTDNGGEYTSSEFISYLENEGIHHQLTAPYCPEQNGVSERKNRTIIEMSRCFLFKKKLPKSFWAESANTAVYLQNILITQAVNNETPYEAWYSTRPSVDHLRIFASICYLHVPEELRDKLQPKAKLGVFIGYSQQSKAYRIYQIESGKVSVSIHVTFDEEQIVDEPLVRGTRPLQEIYESCNVAAFEPATPEEAVLSPEWKEAMKEEMKMINLNKTWSLVDRPKHHHVLGVKWVFRMKLNSDGSLNKHKARLVVKGFAQLPGVDYHETFAPVARMDTIRLLLALSAKFKWKMFHLDIKSAFLNGDLQEEIFIEQPYGFESEPNRDKVYKLHKAPYGLKQAPRAWYCKFDDYLKGQGFHKSSNEATLYIQKADDQNPLIISLYVDDMLVTGGDDQRISKLKLEMQSRFRMTDLGQMSYFVGLQILQGNSRIFICQSNYIGEVLDKFKMTDCKTVATPLIPHEKLSVDKGSALENPSTFRSLIGSLLYICASRPNLMFAASYLSRFMQVPTTEHFPAAKRVLRYLKGTANFGLQFTYIDESSVELVGFSDSDWAGCVDDCKSTSGYVFTLGNGVFC
ncbi:Copia-like retrotransposable element, putative [Theobroma cacao]|uniref:Copia-like retrotransposable element, putative n=1 Tax=Theobroma cacao TaxID=3641 RepID=A0A061FT99_THECC|nr:Copia-like retrotransposable element, putative [Theobroma cacao]